LPFSADASVQDRYDPSSKPKIKEVNSFKAREDDREIAMFERKYPKILNVY